MFIEELIIEEYSRMRKVECDSLRWVSISLCKKYELSDTCVTI